MVGTLDLRSATAPTRNDIAGLEAYLQQLVGQPFLFFRESYGDELTLHLGDSIEVTHPKLKIQLTGSYILSLRASAWRLYSGSEETLTFSNLSHEGKPIKLDDLERTPPILPGARLIALKPYITSPTPGYGLFIDFNDHSRLNILPAAETEDEGDDDLPEIADWELYTPHGMYLQVGPGLTWRYRTTGSESLPSDDQPQSSDVIAPLLS